ncbi:MAG: hypothetical protein EHM42_13190 [Planctomycetaceae bacterium]|nr:MAG: hypothetical protein EHM42_13190 [Planctomycetaceae bacterium]
MQDRLWAILDGMMTLLRMCIQAVRGKPSQPRAATKVPPWGLLWLSFDLDASRIDAVSRSVFWGGAGLSEALESAPAAAGVPPLSTAAAVRALEESPESLWWLGA